MYPHSRFFNRYTSSGFPGPDYDSFRRFHFYRRPSRLLWFGIGAASATLFIYHKQSKSDKAMYWNNCYRPPIQQQQQDAGDLTQVLAGPLPTVPGIASGAQSTPSPYPYSHPHHHAHWSWGFARERSFQHPPPPHSPPGGTPNSSVNASASGQGPMGSVLPTASTESPSVPTPAVQTQTAPWGFESRSEQQKKDWEQERDKLLAKAQDTMTELSESTLDTLSSTVEALKAKLAEHRAKHEQQQKLIDKELEEQKKKPVRYV